MRRPGFSLAFAAPSAAALRLTGPERGLAAVSRTSFARRPQPPPRLRRRTGRTPVRAGAADPAPEGADAATPDPPLSQTAKMAALLGRDVSADAARQKAEAAQLVAENAAEKRRAWRVAGLATLIGFLLAAADAGNPEAPVALMRQMEMASAPLSAIGNGKPTLVDVGATWCTNCKAAARGTHRLTTSPLYEGNVNFIVVDADDPASADVIDRFKVDGIPHRVILDGSGHIKATLVGQTPISVVKDDLQALLDGKDEVPYRGAAYSEVE
jgi:thiol-disulfide isomerase/thioredoxin